MGIAKTINAIGEYDFYLADFNKFAEKLGQLFKVNIHAQFFDNVYINGVVPDKIEDKHFDFNYPETYWLAVNFYQYFRGVTSRTIYCVYELTVPVELEDENQLTLIFHPNGIFELDDLPFVNGWRFFVEDIFELTERIEVIPPILKIRECYIEILRKINCLEVIMSTDALYKSEHEFIHNQKVNVKNSLDDVKNGMKKLDGITILPFMDAINQKIKIQSKQDKYLDIAFYDKF